jgi:drug/metabolite transporter (DMT)-like permease
VTLPGVHSRRAAYVALVLLTFLWGSNWIAMKAALLHADPLTFNARRTLLAVVALFVALFARGGRIWPHSWTAVIVTGFFQTVVNFGATTMAVAGGGAGRVSVLVFTMPFWTLLLAWPLLHERVRAQQFAAIAFAFAGMVLVVAPWQWHGDLAPKLWAVLSGFGWASGTIAMKYYQRDRDFDLLSFITWQMAIGVVPLMLLPLVFNAPHVAWTATHVVLLIFTGVLATAGGFLIWMEVLRWLPAGTASLNMFAVPVIALVLSMLVFGERLTSGEWLGIALIGVGLVLLTVEARRGGRRASALPTEPTPLEGG